MNKSILESSETLFRDICVLKKLAYLTLSSLLPIIEIKSNPSKRKVAKRTTNLEVTLLAIQPGFDSPRLFSLYANICNNKLLSYVSWLITVFTRV